MLLQPHHRIRRHLAPTVDPPPERLGVHAQHIGDVSVSQGIGCGFEALGRVTGLAELFEY
jgi:hypothetical protein